MGRESLSGLRCETQVIASNEKNAPASAELQPAPDHAFAARARRRFPVGGNDADGTALTGVGGRCSHHDDHVVRSRCGRAFVVRARTWRVLPIQMVTIDPGA